MHNPSTEFGMRFSSRRVEHKPEKGTYLCPSNRPTYVLRGIRATQLTQIGPGEFSDLLYAHLLVACRAVNRAVLARYERHTRYPSTLSARYLV